MRCAELLLPAYQASVAVLQYTCTAPALCHVPTVPANARTGPRSCLALLRCCRALQDRTPSVFKLWCLCSALGKPCCCRHVLLWLAVLLAWLCHAPVLYGHAVRFELQCNTCLKEVRVVSLPCLCRVLPVSLPCRAVARPCWCRVLVMSLP